jgi:hypothetical protein
MSALRLLLHRPNERHLWKALEELILFALSNSDQFLIILYFQNSEELSIVESILLYPLHIYAKIKSPQTLGAQGIADGIIFASSTFWR